MLVWTSYENCVSHVENKTYNAFSIICISNPITITITHKNKAIRITIE
jgi:hypothetical protein